MKNHIKKSLLVISVFMLLIASCSKEDKEESKINLVATSITLIDGDKQTAEIVKLLTNPIEIEVKDQNGNAFAGVSIGFSVAEGSVSATNVTTNANGIASVMWTLGETVGTQTLRVTGFREDGSSILNGAPISVTAIATRVPLVPESLELVSGANQTTTVETTLSNAIEVIVKDQNGDPFTGATVNFSVDEGSLSESTVQTDVNGIASVVWTLGESAGDYILTVTSFEANGTTTLTNAPLSIIATAEVLVATSVELVSGDNQIAVTGKTLTNLIEIQVNDQNGNPFTGASITTTLSITEGILNIVGLANGMTTASWRLGASIGTQTLTVTISFSDGTMPLALYVTATAIQSKIVGEFHEGGVVFYVDETGMHGLVCSVNDLSMAAWGCIGTEIINTENTIIGSGAQNTLNIITQCTVTGIAAKLCANLNLNGFKDWFLPSKDALNEMYINKDAIDATATGNGGTEFENEAYWSSSQSSALPTYGAFQQDFEQGNLFAVAKANNLHVRAIRNF